MTGDNDMFTPIGIMKRGNLLLFRYNKKLQPYGITGNFGLISSVHFEMDSHISIFSFKELPVFISCDMEVEVE